MHAGGPGVLELSPACWEVRICGTDPSPHDPDAPLDPGHELEHGRGMMLVEAPARRWGVDPSGAGKTEWAEPGD